MYKPLFAPNSHSDGSEHETNVIALNKTSKWGRVMHICISEHVNIGSDDGLSPIQRQAVIWTNTGILLIGFWRTNFSEIFIEIHTLSFKKMHLKTLSGKWRPFCLGLNVLNSYISSSEKAPYMYYTMKLFWSLILQCLPHTPDCPHERLGSKLHMSISMG